MSPRFIQNMLMFKSFNSKTKPTFNPIMVKIYGKSNQERELFNEQEKKNCNSERIIIKKKNQKKDDKVLSQIHKDFEKQTKNNKKHDYDITTRENIQNSIHSQLLITHSIPKFDETKLAPSYFELLNTIQPDISFKNKLSMREPLKKAKALLSQREDKRKIFESQIRHQRTFFQQSTDLPFLENKRLSIKKNTPQLSLHNPKELVISIDKHCKTESYDCEKILKKCSKIQGRFNSHYEALLDTYCTQM